MIEHQTAGGRCSIGSALEFVEHSLGQGSVGAHAHFEHGSAKRRAQAAVLEAATGRCAVEVSRSIGEKSAVRFRTIGCAAKVILLGGHDWIGHCMRKGRGQGTDRDGEQHSCYYSCSNRSCSDRSCSDHDSSYHYFLGRCSCNRCGHFVCCRVHCCHGCLSVESGPLVEAARGWVFFVLRSITARIEELSRSQRTTAGRQVCRAVVKGLSSAEMNAIRCLRREASSNGKLR